MFLLSLSRTGNEKAGLRFEQSYLGVMGILGIHAFLDRNNKYKACW